MVNKKFLGVLWKTNDLERQKALMLDYLKHCKIDTRIDTPLVYDPVSALNANCLASVSSWLLDLSKISPDKRELTLRSLHLNDFKKEKGFSIFYFFIIVLLMFLLLVLFLISKNQ